MSTEFRTYSKVWGGASVTVAASNSPAYIRRSAKYTCDGTDDNVEIQAALDELANSPSGGTLRLSKGTFNSSAVCTYNGAGLWIRGDTMMSTHWYSNNTDLLKIGTAATQLATFNISDIEIAETGGSSTTAVGIECLSAITKGGYIGRVRAAGFGGGEIILNGATNVTIEDNYISHNRTGGAGSGLKIVENAAASWGVTTIKHLGNYYASSVAGAGPLCLIEDAQTLRSIGNIYENCPAGVVALKSMLNNNVAGDQVFIGEHFEANAGTDFELVDVLNVVVVGGNTAPTFTWSAVAAANRYATVIGPGLSGDITHVRRMLFGLSGPNDIESNSALQVGPVNAAATAAAFMYKGDALTGQASIWRTYADDTGGTPRLLGTWGHFLTTAHASQPSSRFIVTAVPTAGVAGVTLLDLGANGSIIGKGSAAFTSMLKGTVTWDPPSLGNGLTATTTVTVTGAKQNGSAVFVGMNQISGAGWVLSGVVTSANRVTITLTNHTGGTVNLGNGTVTAWVIQV